VSEQLQREFSLHQSLSLYLVETLSKLDPLLPSYALDVVSLVEAVLEHPRPVLYAQERKVKDELFAKLKAEGAEYDARMAELDKATYPKPNADFIYDTFNAYARKHPWLDVDNIRPKSVVRDMYESYASFSEYVKRYGLSGAEGVLLRYLTDAYKTLVQSVPVACHTDELTDLVSYLRATLQRVDDSLVSEWESMLAGEGEAARAPAQEAEAAAPALDLTRDPKALRARLRADMHLLLKALADRDYEEAAALVGAADDASAAWTPEKLAQALAPFEAEHQRLVFSHEARLADKTLVDELEPRLFRVRQLLLAPSGVTSWALCAEIDLRADASGAGRVLRLTEIAS
jgi:hypothetical protein